MFIQIDKKGYNVNEDEFTKIEHQEFNNLKILKDVGMCERLSSLLSEIPLINDNIKHLVCIMPKNGGFIPINCSNSFEKIFLVEVEKNQEENITKNIKYHRTENISLAVSLNDISSKDCLIIEEDFTNSNLFCYKLIGEHILVAKKNNAIIESNLYNKFFQLGDTEYMIFITDKYINKFQEYFKYYIDEVNPSILNYDNLIHLCIMVKNGGPQFEDMLKENYKFIDRWTILDTGSTDDTIEIINKVLVDKKKGELYQEPFINFRDSRNRCFELAGKSCKFLLTLDDTYVVKNDLRKFLNEVRGDQFSDSFSIYLNSDDSEYGSNRIIKSYTGLRYKYRIHEVIQDKDNKNVIIPKHHAYILDGKFDYMTERTNKRKELDLKYLEEELEENPCEPRTYYYFAQTYKCMGNLEMAYKYYLKRATFTNSGFIQERIDAVFEAARLANFSLNKPWEECLRLYELAFKIDESRPDALYFIGINYYLKGDHQTAYKYFKQGYEIGYPSHCQYSLKPTLSFYFLPKFLTEICYSQNDYKLGEEVALFFLRNNLPTADGYDAIMSWYQIFIKLNKCPPKSKPQNTDDKPILVFIADGGFNKWSGSSILTIGVGGSETYIIEMARYIQKHGYYNVVVFSHCEKEEIFEDVQYKNLENVFNYLYSHNIETCIVSRFSEYLPAVYKSYTENVFLVVHDLSVTGVIIPNEKKLKKIFCQTEWHVNHFTNIFPLLKEKTLPFYNGIDFNKFKNNSNNGQDQIQKIPHKFIYSSFPNRGLSILLSMWSKIYEKQPLATLHIYADVNGKWVNDVSPDEMTMIKQMLHDYSQRENNYGIRYHGWVDKNTLAESWLSSDVWFYPCKFAETFCLTALEAALTKTLAITNDLAALQNTVGDRGVVIKGDASTKEWQDVALEKIFEYMDSSNIDKKNESINKNYDWASKLSWENQAYKLVSEHLIEEVNQRGLFNWTNDLPSGSKKDFLNVIIYFNSKNISSPRILEIGAYTGSSLINIVKLIPKSTAIALDSWSNYFEKTLVEIDRMNYIEESKIEKSFYENVYKSGLQNRISAIKGVSSDILLYMLKTKENFDFIYVDGSNKCLDVYMDINLSWEILNKGGLLMMDDYLWETDNKNSDSLEKPFGAINRFLELKGKELKIVFKGYRVCVEKL